MELADDLDPQCSPARVFKMSTAEATHGACYYDDTGALCLAIAYETAADQKKCDPPA